MSAANKKFQQLKRQVHAWKASDYQEDKGLEVKDKFPHCRGTFDTCPSEEEMNTILAKGFAPEKCGRCSVFHDSKTTPPVERKSPLMTPENMEFYLKMRGKKG